MLQHSQAHVLGFVMAGTHFSVSNLFVMYGCKLPTNLGVSNNNHFYCSHNFVDLKLVFPPLGQLVTFSWWVGWSTGPHGWHVGGDDGIPGSAGNCSPESYTGLLQHSTHDGQFHHLRGHSCTENIPRDCLATWVSSDMGLETGTVWLLPLCRGHSSSFKRDKTPASQWDNCQGIYGHL